MSLRGGLIHSVVVFAVHCSNESLRAREGDEMDIFILNMQLLPSFFRLRHGVF